MNLRQQCKKPIRKTLGNFFKKEKMVEKGATAVKTLVITMVINISIRSWVSIKEELLPLVKMQSFERWQFPPWQNLPGQFFSIANWWFFVSKVLSQRHFIIYAASSLVALKWNRNFLGLIGLPTNYRAFYVNDWLLLNKDKYPTICRTFSLINFSCQKRFLSLYAV